jgi:MoaA/NifB/PqqE/SkfB family radical SAM enzyme
MAKDIRVNYLNLPRVRALEPEFYSVIRFDSNNRCNVHCAYCHNPRSDDVIELDDFRQFLESHVLGVEQFQFGCGMEPTMDPRLCDFMDVLAASPAKPSRGVRLQTNGILLHKHDPERMQKAGLSLVTVSVDSVNESTQKGLRGGTNLAKVQRNLLGFIAACPSVRVGFVTVVTSENIDETDDLVAWGVDAGVKQFVFRQVFHYPSSQVVDHSRMAGLTITLEQFAAMRARLESRFKDVTTLHFFSNEQLTAGAVVVHQNSLFAGPPPPVMSPQAVRMAETRE